MATPGQSLTSSETPRTHQPTVSSGTAASYTPTKLSNCLAPSGISLTLAESLIQSSSPTHPANLIPTLCAAFYALGWVTGTGGGASIRHGEHIYIAPSGVQKEKIVSTDLFVMELASRKYLRRPLWLKPSACTPLFLEAFVRGAGCCIHTHSQWAVLVTLLVEQDGRGEGDEKGRVFEIEEIEQIKGIPRGRDKSGYLGYFERLRVPIIPNTAHEEDLTSSLAAAMDKYPDTYAVLVQRHGIYVWGDTVAKAKTQCESLDYIFQLAVRMRELRLPWVKNEPSLQVSGLNGKHGH